MRRLMKRPCQHMGFPMSPLFATSRRQHQWVFEETFLRLDGRAPEFLAPVMDYVYRTWIRSSIFKIHHWSVFMTSIRTNNDEGGMAQPPKHQCCHQGISSLLPSSSCSASGSDQHHSADEDGI
nr:uncharacterized protein LOC105349049 [Crassostrea gigas]